MTHVIRLDSADARWAEEVGRERLATAKGRDRLGEDSARSHIFGASGELAFCRWLDIPWPASVSTYKSEPDVPPFWEIRTTYWQHEKKPGRWYPYRIKVRLDELDDSTLMKRIYVGVKGDLEESAYSVFGFAPWTHAAAHRGQWTSDPGKYKGNPAVFVPGNRVFLFSKAQEERLRATRGATVRNDVAVREEAPPARLPPGLPLPPASRVVPLFGSRGPSADST